MSFALTVGLSAERFGDHCVNLPGACGKLIYSMLVLDGFVETSDGGLDWSTPDQAHRFVNIRRDLVAFYGRLFHGDTGPVDRPGDGCRI